MTLVDNALYVDGERIAGPDSLDRTFELLHDCPGGGRSFAWIGLLRPDDSEVDQVAGEFDLPKLAVEDTVTAHQRPKLERYGETLFVVLRPAWYVDATDDVQVGEVHLFLGADFVITVRHAETPDLAEVRRRLEDDPGLLRKGPNAVLYAVLDRIVDDYRPVVTGLRDDIDQVENEVFGGDPNVSQRIYHLSREVIELQRAVDPLRAVLEDLRDATEDDPDVLDLHRGLRDVGDHVEQVIEQADAFRQLLVNILNVNSALVGQRQNEEITRLTESSLRQGEEVKRISSWAAILFAPALIGAVYGMNFDHMPELRWTLGYPFALALMIGVCLVLYLVFKRRGWL
jgi:magnesium transporter